MTPKQILKQIEKVTTDRKEVLKVVNVNYLSLLPLQDPKRKEWLMAIQEYRDIPHRKGMFTECDLNDYGVLPR